MNWSPAVSGSTGSDASDSCAPWASRQPIRNPGPRFGNRHILYTLISSLIILRIILTAGPGDYATQSGMGRRHHLLSYGAGVCLFSSCPFKLDSRTVDQAKRLQTISKIASPSKKDDSASPILPYLRPRGLVSSNEPLFSGRRAQVSAGSSNRSLAMVDSGPQPSLGRKRARRIRLCANTAEWT